MTDPDDETTPGGMAPVTLEGASDEPSNPFRDIVDYDGSNDLMKAIVKGPHKASPQKVGPIDGVEGYRASLILGGSDPYLQRLKEDGKTLRSLIPGENIPVSIVDYMLYVATFYSFLDFVFMADGTKLVRVWDASVYPAHALYVGGSKEDQNEFDEGDEWVIQGPSSQHDAFDRFAKESQKPGITPFDQFGSYDYRDRFRDGFGPHPVGFHYESGTSLDAADVASTLSEPLFPPSIDPPT